jgi:hypothetical protein
MEKVYLGVQGTDINTVEVFGSLENGVVIDTAQYIYGDQSSFQISLTEAEKKQTINELKAYVSCELCNQLEGDCNTPPNGSCPLTK